MKVKITGTGSCLPKLRVTNDDLGQIMETSDEWIRSRTGIIARHIAVEETTTGMSTEAAGKALKNADISAEDVDIIIAATVSADKHLPGLACEVQKNIGAENAVAFDINAACSGFLFALDTAALYLEHGGYQHALVIGAETLSKMMHFVHFSHFSQLFVQLLIADLDVLCFCNFLKYQSALDSLNSLRFHLLF